MYELKAKCKTAVKTSHEKLSKVFKDTCWNDQASTLVSYKNLESTMYIKARNWTCDSSLCNWILSADSIDTIWNDYRGEVTVGGDIGVIFYFDKIAQVYRNWWNSI